MVASAAEAVGTKGRTADDRDGPRDGHAMSVPDTILATTFAEISNLMLCGGKTVDHVGLILPTSLCSSTVAELYAKRLTAALCDGKDGAAFSRVLSLPHTEGCGHSSGSSFQLMVISTSLIVVRHR